MNCDKKKYHRVNARISKKFNVISLIFILFTAGLGSSSFAFNVENSHLETPLAEKVTIHRYEPDGSITPIQVDIPLEKGQDIQEAIVEKCGDLVYNDREIQNYLSSNGYLVNLSYLARVRSRGKGLHWQSPLRFRIPFLVLLRFRLFPTVPLRYKIFGLNVVPRVHCSYINDEDAETRIETLPMPSRPDKNSTIIEGEHIVILIGFIGYTFWRGMYAKVLDGLGIGTGFDGYACLIFIVRELPEN